MELKLSRSELEREVADEREDEAADEVENRAEAEEDDEQVQEDADGDVDVSKDLALIRLEARFRIARESIDEFEEFTRGDHDAKS